MLNRRNPQLNQHGELVHLLSVEGLPRDIVTRKAIENAVWGMLPKNKLGRQILKKLKVYSGPEHPHIAQQATPFEISQISQ